MSLSGRALITDLFPRPGTYEQDFPEEFDRFWEILQETGLFKTILILNLIQEIHQRNSKNITSSLDVIMMMNVTVFAK